MKKYIVMGGHVTSKNDGDRHYISARKLCDLYGVNPDECYLVGDFGETEHSIRMRQLPPLPVLTPKYDGDYSLPN